MVLMAELFMCTGYLAEVSGAMGTGGAMGSVRASRRNDPITGKPLYDADSPETSSSVGGARYRIAGRVAMDQFVVDVGDDPVQVGDEVVLFGDGARGVPTAQAWADAADTINYEIVTRIGPRVPRSEVAS